MPDLELEKLSNKRKPGQEYSEQVKRDAILLRIWTGSVAEASRQTGIARDSISKWISQDPKRYNELLEHHKGFLDKHTSNRMRAQVLELLKVTDDVISKISNDIDAIPPDKRPEALNKIVWAMGSIVEKGRLLEDKPTSITSLRPAKEIAGELEELLKNSVEGSVSE